MRTTIYVDGFNLYYRALKGTPYRWLDLMALSRALLQPHNQITCIRYFTARVRPYPSNPDQHVRQDTYLKAIAAHIGCLIIHEGRFTQHVVRMPVASPLPGQPRTVEVIKSEEKGSDVNLAVHLLNDAYQAAFDVALVISNDSDLAEGIALARNSGRPIGVANPSPKGQMNAELHKVASFRRRVEEKDLRTSLMPNAVGPLVKPARW